jgi:hypothetical protein
MANTYTLIASSTVGSGGAADITFSSIAATYTDLVILLSARTTSGTADATRMVFNGSTSSYTARLLEGNGATVSSAQPSPAYFIGTYNPSGATASTFSSHFVYVPNYAGSTNKSFSVDSVTENNATTAYANLTAGLWSNSAAITSIKIDLAQGNLAQYSTATLYGISNS